MSNDTATTTRPVVLDSKNQPLELRMRVKLLGAKDKDDAGKPQFGTIVNLEHRRSRVVVSVDGAEKLIVRNASAVMIRKNKSGKIQRVDKAVRAGRKTAVVVVV